jgi:uncharacterized protein (DUF2252 family)
MPGAAPTKPQDRADILSARRNLKMAQSAHAYVRGSTVKFYQWLDDSAGKLPEGPPVWICGDCHIGNLGPVADSKGGVAIQIRDLDQTVIGNPAHDLIRLGLSMASAIRSSDLPGVALARTLEAMTFGYEQALAGDFHDHRPDDRPRIVKQVLKRSFQRRWRHLAAERFENKKPSIPLGKRFWPLTKTEHDALVSLLHEADVETCITGLRGRDGTESVTLLDAAYWVKGCSSLGRLRYAVLVEVGGQDLCLLDIKEATTAAAPRAATAKMPRDNAQRVVAGAQALSPKLGHRMLAARFIDKPVVMRELMPQDLKLEIGVLTHEQAIELAAYVANIVGRAHGRQMDDATRAGWSATLAANRSTRLDAPSWLWSSVVELLGIHESAYLDHCRRYALTHQNA